MEDGSMRRNMLVLSTLLLIFGTFGAWGRSIPLPVKDRYLLLVNAAELKVDAKTMKPSHIFTIPLPKVDDTDAIKGEAENIVVFNDWTIFSEHLDLGHLDFNPLIDTKNPKSLGSRLQEITNYAASAKKDAKPVLIELTEFSSGFSFVTYAKVFDAEADLPNYQKVWKRYRKVTDTVLFVPEYIPKTAKEFEEQLRLRCRIDRDRLLGIRRSLKPAEVKTWVKQLDDWRKTPEKDHDIFVKHVSRMREIFVPGNTIPPETMRVIPSDGTLDVVYSFRKLMRRVSIKTSKSFWPSYEVEIVVDTKGRLLVFDVRYPEVNAGEVIHPVQIRIFLNKALRSDFHAMRNYSPFRKGRQLPEAFPRMCRDFLTGSNADGSSRYDFYSASSSSAAAAVHLDVKAGKVTAFDAMEKRKAYR